MNRRFVAQYYVVTYRTHPTVLAYIFRDGLVRAAALVSLGCELPEPEQTRARRQECFHEGLPYASIRTLCTATTQHVRTRRAPLHPLADRAGCVHSPHSGGLGILGSDG